RSREQEQRTERDLERARLPEATLAVGMVKTRLCDPPVVGSQAGDHGQEPELYRQSGSIPGIEQVKGPAPPQVQHGEPGPESDDEGAEYQRPSGKVSHQGPNQRHAPLGRNLPTGGQPREKHDRQAAQPEASGPDMGRVEYPAQRAGALGDGVAGRPRDQTEPSARGATHHPSEAGA